MELRYDWRGFEEMFRPQRRTGASLAQGSFAPVHVILSGDRVVSAFAEAEDLSEWLGAEFSVMKAQYPHRDWITYDRADVDRWLSEARALPHFQEQERFLKSQARTKTSTKDLIPRGHFLLDAIAGWWNKFLPSSYGVFIRTQGANERDFVLIVRGGVLESFHKPDLNSMGAGRHKDPAEVVKYLSEKNGVTVQGAVVASEEWDRWCQSPDAWRLIALSFRSRRVKLVPFRWRAAALVGLQVISWD